MQFVNLFGRILARFTYHSTHTIHIELPGPYEGAGPTVEQAVALAMLAPRLSYTVWMAPMEHFRGLVREHNALLRCPFDRC